MGRVHWFENALADLLYGLVIVSVLKKVGVCLDSNQIKRAGSNDPASLNFSFF